MHSFDVVVIGAGSGTGISSRAAPRGLSTALIERGTFGGTCINHGCVPSKMLIHSADILETIRGARTFGITVHGTDIDWKSIVGRVKAHTDRNRDAIEQENSEADNTTVIKGEARFIDHKVLEVNGEEIRGETIVISAGSRPHIPAIAGIEDVPYLTTNEALELQEQPRSLAIVGGGYVAAELAHFFGALGTEVTIVEQGPRLLAREDTDLGERFTEVYQRRFKVLVNSVVRAVRRAGQGIALDVGSSGEVQTVNADALLIATGRVPNSDILEVARTGVEVDDRGFVKTDEYLETTVPGIWATGDIVGKCLLKHSGDLEGDYVSHNIFNPEDKIPIDYHAMPHAVFSSPQVAGVGLTEREVEERGIDYMVSTVRYDESSYGGSIEDHDGFVKVLADRDTREILGCHIIGTEASILIQEAAIAMRLRATVDAITKAIYVHPALPEVVQRAFNRLF